jgi:hypothetical protein
MTHALRRCECVCRTQKQVREIESSRQTTQHYDSQSGGQNIYREEPPRAHAFEKNRDG